MMKKVALMFVVVLAVAAVGDAISCDDVSNYFFNPCSDYIQNGSRNPPAACCSGVRGLSGLARSQQDRQTVCNCMRARWNYNNQRGSRVATLPRDCGVSFGFTLGLGMDCTQVA